MPNLPADIPEWLEKSLADLDERASNQIRKNADPSFAAGYFTALADLKDICDTESKLEEAERKKRFRMILHGESPAA